LVFESGKSCLFRDMSGMFGCILRYFLQIDPESIFNGCNSRGNFAAIGKFM